MPKGLTPMPQYAFKTFMLKVSAVRTNYRSLLRSSSIHEPSDPPLRVVIFSDYESTLVRGDHNSVTSLKSGSLATPYPALIKSALPTEVGNCLLAITTVDGGATVTLGSGVDAKVRPLVNF